MLPEVPLRHWVCSLPFQLRCLLGYDRALCADVLNAFVKELSRSYRRRAKEAHALPSMALAHTGAVTVVQRTDSALRLAVHFHTIAIDGAYVVDAADSSTPRFLPLPEPSAAELQLLAERVAARIETVLRKHGRFAGEQKAGVRRKTSSPSKPHCRLAIRTQRSANSSWARHRASLCCASWARRLPLTRGSHGRW